MPLLKNKKNNHVLVPQLRLADNLWTRGKGLLGSQTLPEDQALWIKPTNSIHTFFMKYAIDCVFLSSDLRVHSIFQNVKPGKFIWPQWGATSVIEAPAGKISQWQLSVGDQLDVGT